ncbi:MAG: hypothetical protein DSY57_00735 [Desulfobulbus sp.]|nr:MAG: hypothetical protein DSY57_00735 [Desulfobulbus sp.]
MDFIPLDSVRKDGETFQAITGAEQGLLRRENLPIAAYGIFILVIGWFFACPGLPSMTESRCRSIVSCVSVDCMFNSFYRLP